MVQSEICTDANATDVFFPWSGGMEAGNLLCNNYKGNMTVIENFKMWQALSSKMNIKWDVKDYYSFNGFATPSKDILAKNMTEDVSLWIGFSDEETEGHFVDIIEGKISFNYSLFAKGEPNGNRKENCVAKGAKYGWIDARCSRNNPFFCRMQQNPEFKIRGEKLQQFPHINSPLVIEYV